MLPNVRFLWRAGRKAFRSLEDLLRDSVVSYDQHRSADWTEVDQHDLGTAQFFKHGSECNV